MSDTRHFPPTQAAALERLAAVDLDHYAPTRNHLTGAVSRLSPYITHGFVTLPEVVRCLTDRYPLDLRHKFVYELGWREYSRHLWRAQGDGILRSLHPGVLPDAAYSPALPDDLREARTGIPAIDLAVRTLYQVGYLHNHARMWLASYIIHVRKVSWRTGANWMLGHLLDGDLGSNHLGWQWIAGTASTKPYLFNADNVSRFAPAAWHSPGTVIDASYEALDRIARRLDSCPISTPAGRPNSPRTSAVDDAGISEPHTLATPPAALRLSRPQAAAIRGRDVWLVHPWALRAPPADLASGTMLVGIFVAEFHRQWPWSIARWRFVCSRMQELTPVCWYGDADTIAKALSSARTVTTVADPHFSLRQLPALDTLSAPRLFVDIDHPCGSFSEWWARIQAAASQRPAGD